MSGLKSAYEEFIFVGHYAREKPDGTRESWSEAVNRYLDFVLPDAATDRDELYNAIYNCEVMPSMRALMTAGAAAQRDSMCIYNCAYLAVDNLRAFPEILYVLMSGTGVGFSCQQRYVEQLPPLPAKITPRGVHKVGDSKQGWAEALETHINHLWGGHQLRFDYSDVRPAGAPLKIMGGRASGHGPLKQLLDFVTSVATAAVGRRLTTAEVNDVVCNIAEIVVVGGVRRSALISLTDLADNELRTAKSGQWWTTRKWLALENISAVYTEKPSAEVFLEEWLALIKSHSGERGIFNSQAAVNKVKSVGRRSADHEFGTNPCSEIILRSRQVCNLTEVVLRANDDFLTVQRKVKIATILGTLQSRFTHFPYLSAEWKKNCQEERLLGVSITGICDNTAFSNVDNPALPQMLESLRRYAVAVNAEYARRLGINASTSITCVKPSGTVSQLVDSASGIHPRWSEYYIRTVRIDKKDPLYEFMKRSGVPCEDENGHPDSTAVLSFPQRSEGHRGLRAAVTALQQLRLWQIYNQHWCEHKPSATIYVRPHEWVEVGNWVYEHFDSISGVSFLPYDNGSYQQAPYQEIKADAYHALIAAQPKIDWKQFKAPKKNNRFTYACGGAGCELVDLSGAATE
jgi:ribonucleoside-diphosphate reductase alpha chain